MVLGSVVLRKIYGLGEYGAEGDIWCWRVWCRGKYMGLSCAS
jgi:hypothetical protein